MQEQRNSGGFLEYLAALSSACVDYLGDPALTDDGISVPAESGAKQHFLNVLESGLRAVDEVLTLAAAVKLTGDSHLVGVHGERTVGIVDTQRDLGESHGFAVGGTVEDNVLHLLTAQGLCALLSHNPAQGVAYVALTVAVAADDGGGLGVEIQYGLVRKGFEPMYLQ